MFNSGHRGNHLHSGHTCAWREVHRVLHPRIFGKAYVYPTNLTLGESGTVIIGVVNHEYETVTYRVVVKLDNETIAIIEDITLSHEGKWEQNYTFTPQKTGERMKLEFLLYREGVEEPYRTLHLWVTVRLRE